MSPIKLTFAAAVVCFAIAAMSASANAGPTPAEEAFALRMDGKSDEARLLLLDSLAEDASDAAAWFELARTEFYHFQFDAAEDAMERAIALSPDDARYRYLAGLTAAYNAVHKHHDRATRSQSKEEMGKSLASFREAVELDPDYHDARIMLINMLIEAPGSEGGSRSEARKQVEILEALDEVRGLEGRCMVDDASDRKTVRLWKEMMLAHARNADAHQGLGKAYLNASRLELAEDEINEAIRLDPTRTTLLIALCRESAHEKDYDRALAAAKQYLDTDPPAPMRSYATFCIAVLNKKQGNKEEAEALLTEAKQIDPHCWTTYMEPPGVLFEGL